MQRAYFPSFFPPRRELRMLEATPEAAALLAMLPRMFPRPEESSSSSSISASPLRTFRAALLVALSASRYSSTSFFSAAVSLKSSLLLPELEELDAGLLLPELLEEPAPLAASSRDFWVTPVALAMAFS